MSQAAVIPPYEGGFTRSRSVSNTAARAMNNVVVGFCCLSALLTILILFLIFGYILYKGFSSLNAALFTALPGPALAPTDEGYRPIGLRNCIAGTAFLIAMASCVGVPIGMICGIYLAEYSRDNWFSHGIRLVVDVLAGVPSIIVGVLGYELAVIDWKPFVAPDGGDLGIFHAIANAFIAAHNWIFPSGFSAWAGALALGFMMCPIIARTTEEMLKLVPRALREASIGLGASKFQTLFRVVIPTASAGIITGVMLAVARVAGETAPLLFTILGSDEPTMSLGYDSDRLAAGLSWLGWIAGVLVLGAVAIFVIRSVLRGRAVLPSARGVITTLIFFAVIGTGAVAFHTWVHPELDHAFPSLTIKIFEYAGSPEPEWIRQAWAGMLILIVMVLILNVGVRVASNRKKFKAA